MNLVNDYRSHTTIRCTVLTDFARFEWLRRTTWVMLQNQPLRSLLQVFSIKSFPRLSKPYYPNSDVTDSMHKRNVENDIQIEATAHTPRPDVTILLWDDSGVWPGSSSRIIHPALCSYYPTNPFHRCQYQFTSNFYTTQVDTHLSRNLHTIEA